MNGSIHIKGSISKVIFFNSDTGYGVVKIKLDPKDKNTLELINKDYITSIDTTCVFDRKPIEGEEYEFIGNINFDPRYGEQFKGQRFIRRDPNTLESVVAYLSSDLFMGVGPIIARKIYDELGPDCLNIIINDKKSLDNIKINNVVKDNIYNGLIENKEKEEETINLLNLGLTMNATNKIMALIPKGASQKIKKNPYILIDIVEGIGFIKADNIALNIGIKKNALIRIKAFINYLDQTTLMKDSTIVVLSTLLSTGLMVLCYLLLVKTTFVNYVFFIVSNLIVNALLAISYFINNRNVFVNIVLRLLFVLLFIIILII